MPMDVVSHLFAREMRKPGAIGGTHFVDRTHIGLQVEELAGIGGVHPIALLILIKPFFPERRWCHAQVTGDAVNIGLFESGRHFLAAVCTTKTVYFLPYFPVNLHGHLVQLHRWFFFYPGKKTPECGFMSGYFKGKGTEVDRFHA